MATIVSGNHPKLQWEGIYEIIQKEYKQHEKQCGVIFHEDTSKKSYEELVATAGFGIAPAKSQGASITYDEHSQQGTVRATHTTYAIGAKVTMEEIDDNLYFAKGRDRARMIRESVSQTEEIVSFNVLNNGFTGGSQGYDGVDFLSDAHVTYDAGTQANELVDSGGTAAPADLSEASLEDLLIQIMDAKDTRGKRIAIKPRRLVVPTANAFEAHRIVKSNLQNDTGNNATNAIRDMGMFPDGVFVSNYLTDNDAFFVQTDIPARKGLVKFNRMPFELAQDNEFDTMNACMRGVMRFSVVVGDWRCMYGSPGV